MKIIDCHNHSLPNIDDGAQNFEMALEMLKVAESNGTSDIILTPHHLNGAFTNFADDVVASTSTLQKKAHDQGLSIQLHYGSEVHLVPETADHLITKKALTFCGLGKAALIELPKHSIPTGTENILSKLLYNGITPVIAHPERNSSLRRDISPLKEWIELGCKSQITGQSCTGEFGASLQKLSFKMIAKGLVHLVASDAHRPTGRSPNLKQAAITLNDTFDKRICHILLHENPSRLIKGEDLVDAKPQLYTHQKKSKKRNWFRWLATKK